MQKWKRSRRVRDILRYRYLRVCDRVGLILDSRYSWVTESLDFWLRRESTLWHRMIKLTSRCIYFYQKHCRILKNYRSVHSLTWIFWCSVSMSNWRTNEIFYVNAPHWKIKIANVVYVCESNVITGFNQGLRMQSTFWL